MESNIYNYEMIRAMMKSPKRDILLNHVYNDDYTIIEVLRPHYERIYDRDKVKTKNK